MLCFLDGKLCKKKKRTLKHKNKESQQEVSVNMQMCCGWTRRSFWLLLNEVSANTVCMPTSPYPTSKLFSEVRHTNWKEIGSLSFENCWAALSFRYKTLPSAKEEQYDLFSDCIHSNTWSPVQVNQQEQAGSQGCPVANPPPPSYPLPP